MSRRIGHIYAYTTPAYCWTFWRNGRLGWGLIKVGYTTRDPHTRIREQIGASSPEKNPYKLLYTSRSRTRSGRSFTDKDVHRELRAMGVHNVHNEWFEARPRDIRKAIKKLGGKRSKVTRPRSSRRSKRGFPKLMIPLLAIFFIWFAIDPAAAALAIKRLFHFLIEVVIEST